MSTNYSTTNQSYKHLSEAERGEIEAYLSVGLKPAEITRRLGRNRSTIKHLGKSIEERPEEINNCSRFGDSEIDSVLGGKTIGAPSILNLVERQSQRNSWKRKQSMSIKQS